MIMMTEDRDRQRDDRLLSKTQDETLMRSAMAGAGLTHWEALVLPSLVSEIYFATPGSRPWQEGQVRYQCTALSAGAGVALSRCPQVSVVLSLLNVQEDRAVQKAHGVVASRRARLCRITEEAREQGGLLTQEDVALLFSCAERTIRRDVKELLRTGIHVATRGFVKDIGPSVSHKGIAIRHWLSGKEPVEVARQINHSLSAVERYLEGFRRVAFCASRDFELVTIARMTKLSDAVVRTYKEIYDTMKDVEDYAFRFEEIALVAETKSPNIVEKTVKKGDLATTMIPSPCLSRAQV